MTEPNSQIDALTLRDATAADESFLRDLFAATRRDELAALAADSEQAEHFIDSQFKIQQQIYRLRYPQAQNKIILSANEPIGRILVDRSTDIIVLVDIALSEAHRQRGVGSTLIRNLLAEAASLKKSVKLSVYKLNPAIRLYERLGFCRTADDGVYLEMYCRPN